VVSREITMAEAVVASRVMVAVEVVWAVEVEVEEVAAEAWAADLITGITETNEISYRVSLIKVTSNFQVIFLCIFYRII
jgi:hypothetical protein